MEERFGQSAKPETTEEYSSVVSYLYEDPSDYCQIRHRALEVAEQLDELLLKNDNGKITGVVDATYFELNPPEGLPFIRDRIFNSSKDLLELEEVTLSDGTLLEDLLYEEVDQTGATSAQARLADSVIKRRVELSVLAMGIIAEDAAAQARATELGCA